MLIYRHLKKLYVHDSDVSLILKKIIYYLYYYLLISL